MDTALQTQQNFSDFWQAQHVAVSTAPPFFYNPSTVQRPGGQSTNHSQPQQGLATTNDQQQQLQLPSSASSSNPSSATSSAFQSALQQRAFSGPFGVFAGTERSMGIQHPGFRPSSPNVSHFGPTSTAASQFASNFPAGLLHSHASGPHVPFASAAASVGFDLMGNFGLNTMAGQSQFTIPQMNAGIPASLHPSSTALMPLNLSAIYANGGGIQRHSNFIQSSAAPTAISSLGQSTLGSIQQQQPTSAQLFDLSNQMAASIGPANSVIAAAVSNAVDGRQPETDAGQSQQSIHPVPFGPLSAPGAAKGVTAEIAKIPKETATIPLESGEGTSSSTGTVEQRSQSHMSCQVCHLAASNGLHFGARTCAACAAFFRRSISDQKRYICKRSQRCVIKLSENGTQGYRKMCRNCRMKRCLEIGMLPENVQNKRNKREYYFVDALQSAIQQQQAGVIQQRRHGNESDGTIAGIAIGQHLEGKTGKVLAPSVVGDSVNDGIAGQQLNPIEKFEPTDKELSNNAGIANTGFAGLPTAQAHQFLAPMLIGGLKPLSAGYCQQQPTRATMDLSKNVNRIEGGGLVYSTPTTTTNPNQRQLTSPPFSWGLTASTLREI